MTKMDRTDALIIVASALAGTGIAEVVSVITDNDFLVRNIVGVAVAGGISAVLTGIRR